MRKSTTTIIGHRGAAGLELENTVASFKHAIALGVDAIEFDVHVTKDGQFVVCHDPDLSRISASKVVIKHHTYEELRQVELHNGQYVPLLSEVLALAEAAHTPVIVELKVNHHLAAFCAVLDTFPEHAITVASFHHGALQTVRHLRPDLPVFLAEKHHPIEVIKKAKALHATGTDLNVHVLNPVTYWMAKRANIEIMVYTVDNVVLGKLVQLLYPGVQICTNQPKRFMEKQLAETPQFKWYATPTFAKQYHRLFTSRRHKYGW